MKNDYASNQVAIITGGADGLGLALAERLAQTETCVCLLDIDAAKLKQAQAKLGDNSRIFAVDITQAEVLAETIQKIFGEFGRIDILVNSAGITGQTNLKSHEVDLANFEHVMALNVKASFLTCRAVLPYMLKADYGRILNIASIAGKEGNAGMVAYSTSKAAVIGMTKSMGKEYAETGITINALAPAVIRTAMVAAMPDVLVKYMTDKIPMKRCGTLEEFAAMAEFIVSPQNSFTTGFCFNLSGGRAVY
ncbi:MAG: SDR family NAD(P)-dependent oxidoreductase [Chthoniobacterales bacterium]